MTVGRRAPSRHRVGEAFPQFVAARADTVEVVAMGAGAIAVDMRADRAAPRYVKTTARGARSETTRAHRTSPARGYGDVADRPHRAERHAASRRPPAG